MKPILTWLFTLTCIFFSFTSEGVDSERIQKGADEPRQLAVAEPVTKGGMKSEDTEMVWSMLESTVDGGFEVISRSALKQMMTEIGLTVSSDLMSLNNEQKAKLGQLKGVKYILVPTLGKMGSRLEISLLLLESSTGQILSDHKTRESFESLDEFSDRLTDMLTEINLGPKIKTRGKSALLHTTASKNSKFHPGAYIFNTIDDALESGLVDEGIALVNLKNVNSILKKNKIGDLANAEPSMYMRVGQLLRVDRLIQPSLTRYDVRKKSLYIAASNKSVTLYTGDLEGNIRIIHASKGDVFANIRFKEKITEDDFDEEDTENWSDEDYQRALIERVFEKVLPKLIKKLK